MSSLATVINSFVSAFLASCSDASASAAVMLSAPFASQPIDQLNLSSAHLLICAALLLLASYFSFTVTAASYKIMKAILIEPSHFELQQDSEAVEIELTSINAVTQQKTGDPASDTAAPDNQPEATDTNSYSNSEDKSAVVSSSQPKFTLRSRRNSIRSRPKSPSDIGYVNLTFDLVGPDNNIFIPPNHERITLITDDDIEYDNDIKDHICTDDPPESYEIPKEKKPFEYYLTWDLPVDELEQLTYSEKSRRFYFLTNHGEIKKEAEPPEPIIVSTEIELYHEPLKPMNLITDLIQQANRIDIPNYQIELLKLNHQLTHSYLKTLEMKKFDFSPVMILKGRFDFFRQFKFKQSAINLDKKVAKSEQIIEKSVINSQMQRNTLNFRGKFSLNTCVPRHQIDLNIFNPKISLKYH